MTTLQNSENISDFTVVTPDSELFITEEQQIEIDELSQILNLSELFITEEEQIEIDSPELFITEEEQIEIDQFSQILNSDEFSLSKSSMSRGADFCTTYNQIKSHVASTISLLYKGAKLRILPNSWRDTLRNAARVLELLKQFCEQLC